LKDGEKMIGRPELIRWLRGADDVFEALEGRGDAYNICRRWVDEWFCCGEFCITDLDKDFLQKFKENLELLVRVKLRESGEDLRDEVNNLVESLQTNTNKLAFAFAPYFVSWNISRFIRYLESWESYDKEEKRESLISYFSRLNGEIANGELLENLKELRKYHILEDDWDSCEEKFKKTYEKIEEILKGIGVGEREPVGTVKIMHIIAPYCVPLLDNPIAKSLKEELKFDFFRFAGLRSKEISEFFKEECKKLNENRPLPQKKHILKEMLNTLGRVEIEKDSFWEYSKWIKGKVEPFREDIFELEKATGKSFLKLLDQAFYVRYSIDIARRLRND
jgi:hypothetical protein